MGAGFPDWENRRETVVVRICGGGASPDVQYSTACHHHTVLFGSSLCNFSAQVFTARTRIRTDVGKMDAKGMGNGERDWGEIRRAA